MVSYDFKGFPAETLKFLRDLSRHNNRDWFRANEHRYDEDLIAPCFSFIRAMAPRLAEISPHFVAEPRKARGSLTRIHRDVRFSSDKTPYHTHIGVSFYHERQRKTPAPGFYVHITPIQSFLGIGIWHPDSVSLKRIRSTIVADPEKWTSVRDDRTFRRFFELGGDSLVKPPHGYPKEHPLIDDLKRKDFVAFRIIESEQLLKRNLVDSVAKRFRASGPFVHFLCDALNVPF